MKKIATKITAIFLSFSFLIGLSGCFEINNNTATPSHTHNYVVERVVAPTCEEDGYTVYVCECGQTKKGDYVNKLEHVFDNYVYNNNATESSNGTKTATCSREGCSAVDEVEVWGSQLEDLTLKLVEYGSTDYVIRVPDNYQNRRPLKTAVNDLQALLEEATDIKFEIVKNSLVNGGKYISITDNGLLDSEQQKVIDGLESDSTLYFSLGHNIFLTGGSDYGTAFAIYDFLSDYFGFEPFTESIYTLDKDVYEKNISSFYKINEPDLSQRHLGSWRASYLTQYRFRTVAGQGGYDCAAGLYAYTDDPKYAVVNGINYDKIEILARMHNSLDFIPYEKYGSSHSGWYATDRQNNYLLTGSSPAEVCFTAHGNAEEYQALQNTYFEAMKKMFIQRVEIKNLQKRNLLLFLNSDWNIITIWMEDSEKYCDCEGCNQIVQKYGGYTSSVVIRFTKDLKQKIDDWFNSSEGSLYKIDDFKLRFSVSQKYGDAPVKFNQETGEYEVIYDDLKLGKGYSILLTNSSMLSKMNYEEPYTSQVNGYFIDRFKKWSSMVEHIDLYTYQSNFSECTLFMDSFELYDSEFCKFLVENGVKSWYNECVYSSGWFHLKQYAESKFYWDNSLGMEEIYDRYFSVVFPTVPSEMRNLFEMQKTARKNARDKYLATLEEGEKIKLEAVEIAYLYDEDELKDIIYEYQRVLSLTEEGSEEHYQIMFEMISPLMQIMYLEKERVPVGFNEKHNTNYPVMTSELVRFKALLMDISEKCGEKFGNIIASTHNDKPILQDRFLSSVGYNVAYQTYKRMMIIPQTYDNNTANRILTPTVDLEVGDHRLQWIYLYHRAPFALFDYTDIKMEVISGEDVISITPNQRVIDGGGKILSSLTENFSASEYNGTTKYDYGTLTCIKKGTAVIRFTYTLDGIEYTDTRTINVI